MKLEMKLGALAFTIVLAVVIPLVLGVWWLFWQLWVWVLPQVWATGPEAVIRPGYWLFVGYLILASMIGNVLFGNRRVK